MIKISTKPPKLVRWYMDFFKYDGLATVWNTVYFREPELMTKKLLRHESKHIEQMEREGKLLYLLKYHYYWITRGYKDNPYETEARASENEI